MSNETVESITEEQAVRRPRTVFRGSLALSNGDKVKMETIEFLPQIRMCKFYLWGQRFKHYLALPCMQFTRYWGKQGVSLHISFKNEPLKDIHDVVYFPPLPNIWYPSLQCCLMRCPSDSFHDMMAYFWNTEYLDCEDWYSFPILDKETPMRTFKQWEKMTEEDPTFILDVEWTQPAIIAEIPHCERNLPMSYSYNKGFGTDATNRANKIRDFAVVRKSGEPNWD